MNNGENRLSFTAMQLKIIAVVTMTIDHIGAYLLPNAVFLRIIGRVSFPIFAFMVVQGCQHTKNIYKYLAKMLSFAAVTQVLLVPIQPLYNLNILFTFTLSIALVIVWNKSKQTFLCDGTKRSKLVSAVRFAGAVVAVYILCTAFDVEYGFYGCMLAPVAVVAGDIKGKQTHPNLYIAQLSAFTVVLVLLSFSSYSIQNWSLVAVPLLYIYNGRKGQGINKNFFYLYYPLHLVVIHIINIFI